MTQPRPILFPLVCLAITAACNSGSSALINDTGDAGLSFDDIEDERDIETLCEEGSPETYTAVVRFEALRGGCPFGEGDNLDEAQGYMTARIEQTAPIALPDQAVICDVAFDFQAVSGGQGTPMVYDDHFIFTFNDVVLASSYGPLVETLRSNDGVLYEYAWEDARGYEISFDDDIPTYCVGEDEGYASCDIPPPETRGLMSLQFEEAISSQLALQAIEQDRYEMTFITLGDNDTSDCSHEDFAFEVEIPYVAL